VGRGRKEKAGERKRSSIVNGCGDLFVWENWFGVRNEEDASNTFFLRGSTPIFLKCIGVFGKSDME
jgi:hypothetical protein